MALLLLLAAAAGPWLAQYRATLRARQHDEELARERAEEKAAARERETRAAEERAERAAAQGIGLAHLEWTFHNVKGAEELLDQCPDRFRGWEWDYLKGLCHAELLTLRGHAGPVAYAAFLGDGQTIASAGADQTARTWDALTGQPTRALGLRVGSGVAFSPDGHFLAAAPRTDVKDVYVWDVRTNRPHLTLRGHGAPVSTAAFGADGRRLVTADTDKVVKVWDVTTGDCLHTLRGHPDLILSVALSPDGKTVLAGGMEGTVLGWDAATGRQTLAPRGHLRGQFMAVSAVAFSPDGGRFATASNDGTARVWDAATGKELLTLRGHNHEVYCAVFSPDGSLLASSSFDGTVKVWDGRASALPPTDGWTLLFADDFERRDLGDRWETREDGGRWSVEGGALRGELVKTAGVGGAATAVRLRIDPLPSTAEVRFDCWSPDAVNCETYLCTEDTARGVVAVLMGGKNQWVVNGPQGVSLVLQSGHTLFQEVAFSHKVWMERNRRYHVRVLREPRRLSVFVDGVQVVSAPAERVPELDLPSLRLQASMGQPGNVIYFDNVEVRAPPAALQEQQARALVARLFDQLLLRADVVERIQGNAALSESVRKLALQLAQTHPEDARKLVELSWPAVNDPSAGRAAHAKALRRAEAAARLAPDNWKGLDLLGGARNRAGQYEEAVKTLTRATELARADLGSAEPRQYAFLAMARHRLGRAAEARADFVRLRDLMKGSTWAGKDQATRPYREAEALLRDSLKEDAADREKEAIKDIVFKAVQVGWVNHDLPAHLALFTDDARSIGARAEEPGPADVVLVRKRMGALRPLQFRDRPEGLSFSFEDVRVDVTGDEAVLHCRAIGQWDDGFAVRAGVERLRRTSQGWKVYEERGWTLKQKVGPRTITFNAEYLRERDAQAQALRGQGKPRELALALAEARRPAEAHAVARELTAAADAPAADWALRGDLAFRAGDLDDMRASFRRAQRIDPEIELPRYMSRELRTFHGHAAPVFGVAFNDDGKLLASGGDDRAVKVWGAATGRELRTLRGHTQRVSGVAFGPDGRRIASASRDHTAKVWDAATGQELRTLSGHTERVLRVAFSPDGRRLVTASADRTARVWDAETGQPLLTLGARIVSGSFGQLALSWRHPSI